MEYEFGKYLPGGAHAIAFLFIEIDPSLADFNIHPAKKEVRLKKLAELRTVLHELLSHELVHRYGGMTQAFETAIYPEFKEFDFSTKEKEIAPGLADQPQVLHSTKYDREMGREFTNCSSNSFRRNMTGKWEENSQIVHLIHTLSVETPHSFQMISGKTIIYPPFDT